MAVSEVSITMVTRGRPLQQNFAENVRTQSMEDHIISPPSDDEDDFDATWSCDIAWSMQEWPLSSLDRRCGEYFRDNPTIALFPPYHSLPQLCHLVATRCILRATRQCAFVCVRYYDTTMPLFPRLLSNLPSSSNLGCPARAASFLPA